MLGNEDHGILTTFLDLDFGDFHQGFGGYALDKYDEDLRERVPSLALGRHISEIFKVAGVDRWESLKGCVVRVEMDGQRIVRIGHYLKDIWFNPQEMR